MKQRRELYKLRKQESKRAANKSSDSEHTMSEIVREISTELPVASAQKVEKLDHISTAISHLKSTRVIRSGSCVTWQENDLKG